MQLVIDIPEGTKRAIDMGSINQVLTYKVWDAIKNGTPLLKHHGDLKDVSKLDVLAWQGKSDEFAEGVIWAMEELDKLPTIIPATKEGE